jgi:hypothetical protein
MMRWTFPLALLLAAATPAAANPIDTTLTLTGAPGAWVYTLDFTNNTALYVFEVDVPNPFAGGVPAPAGWVGTGGIRIGADYCNDFACSMVTADSIAPGQSLAFNFGYGFTDPVPIYWDVIAADPANFSGTQQLYSGTIDIAVPEPGTLSLLIAGLAFLWASTWDRRRRWR